MSDLIRREDVIKCLQENGWLDDTNIDELIETIPIAYDINKVVEELEEIKDEYDNSCIDNAYQRGAKTGAKWMKKKAIEIVKAGVKNE